MHFNLMGKLQKYSSFNDLKTGDILAKDVDNEALQDYKIFIERLKVALVKNKAKDTKQSTSKNANG